MKSEKYSYQKEWEEYRRRRNWDFGTFFAGFIFLPLGFLVLNLLKIDVEKYSVIPFLLFAVWATVYLIHLARFNTWKCPHCQQQFFTYSFWATSPIMIDKCRNCKLPKYYGSTFYKSEIIFFPKT